MSSRVLTSTTSTQQSFISNMLDKFEVIIQYLYPRISSIEYIDSLISLVDCNCNRLHKLILATPLRSVSANRIIVIGDVEIEGIVLDWSINHRYFETVPTGFRYAKVDFVSTVITVEYSNQVYNLVIVSRNELKFGIDGIATCFPSVAMVINSGERYVVLDTSNYVSVQVCRA